MSYRHKGFDNDGFEMDVPDTGYGTIGKPPNNDIYCWNDTSLRTNMYHSIKITSYFREFDNYKNSIKVLICYYQDARN